MGRGHVNIGGKDRDEEQGETPAGQKLNFAHGNQQPETAKQLENAADLNAGKMKRNPGRHNLQEEFRMPQMDRSCKNEERSEK